ncbi:sirohydrochlorin chelatase [Jeotgalibacillus campisalis]|uniref:Cobalamin biosynthesis protein CbiX n=1 Tax=Jeotgalibacillus campisalis TaxID=220754 RepID=A0A0C2RNB3_9BACL|nr:sirohydrochlorin chelatase [Jeotgalibacillus campisalis]KIL51765.1 cobalamin biosynthesis protein CbiX [Jeotgalibacillus campisalis]
MKAILYIGHGTRSKKGANEAKQFLEAVMGYVNAPIQEVSFLELTPPFIEEGFRRCVERGATEIKIVPIFLLTAGHIKQDIPDEIAPLHKRYPDISITTTEALGVQEVILDAIAELVKRHLAGPIFSADSILLVGRGSSDPQTRIAFNQIAEGIKRRLTVSSVDVCYLAAIEPTFDQGLETITAKEKGRIIVIPYLLFGGLLLNEVQLKVKQKQKLGHAISCTDSLARHNAIQQIVIDRANAEGERYAAVNH